MHKTSRFQFATILGFIVFTVSMAGCPFLDSLLPGTGQDTEKGPAKLIPFESSQDLLSYFRQQASARFANRNGGGFLGVGGSANAPMAAEDSQGVGESTTANSDDYSTTNLQETGVDESDVFKSDGTHFYIAEGHKLRIVLANPAEDMVEVSSLDLGSRIDSLYLYDSTVIALGTEYPNSYGYGPGGPEIMMWPPYYHGTDVVVYQIDVSQPDNPTISKQIELDGSLVSSRLTNDRLIVVLTIMPELPDNPSPDNIGQMTLEEVMPKVRRSGGSEEVEIAPWNRWLRPASPDGYNMAAVVTLDASNVETMIDSVSVLANAGTIYASTEALYLTDAKYDPQDNFREKIAIHKFAFDDNGAAQYVASGSIPGRLLNQFSLGEYDGYLRVATHIRGLGAFVGTGFAEAVDDAVASDGRSQRQNTDVNPPYNAVYVLSEADAKLDVVGWVDGIAPNEQIYSARFMNTHGFLVTFRQIDPLFVLDLSDPLNPKVVGELKIPGYSDYLHPLGDTHLIGVGRSMTETQWGGTFPDAVQLSLFDVSDWTNPTLVQQISVGGQGSYSEVSQTHKAFTLIEREGQTLLAIPAILTEEGNLNACCPEFAGVLCYSVDTSTGFTELGRVASIGRQVGWWPLWQRAAFIEDALYALTPEGVRAVRLADFNTTYETTFSSE